LDDYTADNVVPSPDDIEQAIGYHRALPPLFTNLRHAQNVVVGTRWAERDLIKWVKENESFRVYSRASREDPVGNPDPRGQPTYPERFDEEVLSDLERRMGPYLFSCLFMNSPMSSGEMVFRQEWVKYYETEPQDLLCYTTVDLASDPREVKGLPDNNVVLTTGKNMATGNIYVLDYFAQRVNPGEVIDEIFRQVRLYRPIKVGVESVQYQSTLKYWVQERMKATGEYFFVENLPAGRRSKADKIRGLQPLFAANLVFIRPFMQELVAELVAHPFGKHDDIIDALAMQLPLWNVTRGLERVLPDADPHDPFAFDNIVSELRNKGRKRGFPYDMLPSPVPSPMMGPWARDREVAYAES
jgi:predicted phage terminase large subunit-like protein